ncbi:MAG: hypothetical protein JJT94_01115 [Bernardetiaceae bacterium]|nr:hypothetical protein [Bernardetiaceae bacterium]
MKYTRYFWFMSMIGILVLHLFAYASLSESVKLQEPSEGMSEWYVYKDAFFYWGLAFIVLSNMMILLLGRIIPLMPRDFLPVPKRQFWGRDMNTRKFLRDEVNGWFKGIGLLINIFISVTIIDILFLNREIPSNFDPSVVLWALIPLFLAWVVTFILVMRNTEPVRRELGELA